MSMRFSDKLRAFNSDQRGAAFILVTLAMPTILGLASLVTDLGYYYYVNGRIQQATDLGVLAGATLLSTGDADAIAAKTKEYVEINLPEAWRDNGSTVKVNTVVKALCSTKLESGPQALTCYGAPNSPNKVNYVSVSVSASVPLLFASALGLKSMTITADGVASGGEATMPPLNVAIILDTTLSMNSTAVTASSSDRCYRLTKIQCAKLSAMSMVSTLWPVVDKVALYTYPGMVKPVNQAAATANIAKNICATGYPTTGDYKLTSGTNYKIIDFSDEYRDKKTPPTVAKNSTDPLVQSLDSATCTGLRVGSTNGLQPSFGGGGGSNIVYTFYADAIDQAQADLEKVNQDLVDAGQAPRQNVMVILSDGDANATAPSMIEAARQPNQCLQAIQAAQRATEAGTWVYSVANNASTVAGTGSGGTCRYDTSQVTGGQVTVTKIRTTTTYTMTYNSSTKRCGGWVKGTPRPGSPQTTIVSAPGPTPGNSAITTTTPTGTCSKSKPSVTYTEYYDTTSVTPMTTTQYDRSACDTMRALASSPDKFFSDDTVCKSAANPNVTDLTKIFQKVAIGLMKKRRIPLSAIN